MRASPVVLSVSVLLLGACASPTPGRYAEVNCGSAMGHRDPGPYRPGVLCLVYQDVSPNASQTTGARSGPEHPTMKAVRVDGRIYFVNTSRQGPLPDPM